MTDIKRLQKYSSLMGASIATCAIFTGSYLDTWFRDISYTFRPEPTTTNLTRYFQAKDEFRRLAGAEELSNPDLEASRHKYFSDLVAEMTRIEQTHGEEIKAYEERQAKVHDNNAKKMVFYGSAAFISFMGAVIFGVARKKEKPQP